jgi:hypothetical protein
MCMNDGRHHEDGHDHNDVADDFIPDVADVI